MKGKLLLGCGGLIVAGLLVGQPADGNSGGIGADVIYTEIGSIRNWGNVGGIHGYSLGSHTCNVGDEDLLWTNRGTPGLAMNAYRLHDGRLVQVGQSWVKHACCAAAQSGCGVACNGRGGDVLGVGCRDVYSAGWNGGQSRLGPRSGIDPYSGEFAAIPGGSGNAVFRRLQIAQSDLEEFPGALYFAEGVYAATDDAQDGNWLNNASYKRVTVGGGFDLVETGSMNVERPGIFAWHDHGNGPNTPDPSVTVVPVDIPNEGRFFVAAKATQVDSERYRYDYALFNLNSHRSAGAFTVPIPSSALVTDVGFHDVNYHSGEVYDNTDWSMEVKASEVTWSSPATFKEDPNTNALRWGTMYNFWIEVDEAPVEGDVTIGLFRPGTPDDVTTTLVVPGNACPEDIDGDNDAGFSDLLLILAAWGPCDGDCPEDLSGNGAVDFDDILILLAAWGPCE